MANSAIVGILRALLTADTSEFTAKMAASATSVQELGKALQRDLEPRQRAVNNAVRDFLGGTEIRKAEEFAQAVEKIGGVSKLTEADQRKVNRAVAEALEHYKVLGMQAPASLTKLHAETLKVQTATTGLAAAQQHIQREFGSSISRIKDIALGYITGEAALQAFAMAGRFAIDFLKDSVTEALKADQAQRKLTAALTAQGIALPGVLKLYDDLATKYQNTTVHSDDLIKEQAALLTQIGSVMPSEMDKALQAATNLAAGLGKDLTSATVMVGKAFEDNFVALKKAGVDLDVARAKAEGMDYVLGQINAKFGGQAQAEAASYAGQVKRLGNAFDEVKESAGKAFLESGAFDVGLVAARLGVAMLDVKLKDVADTLKTISGAFSTMMALASIANPLIIGRASVPAATTPQAPSRGDLTGDVSDADFRMRVTKLANDYREKQQQMADDAKKAAEASQKAWAAAVTGIAEKLSGAKVDEEIAKTSAAVTRLGAEIDTAELPALVKQIQQWYEEGRKLPPVLEAIRAKQALLNRELAGGFNFQDDIAAAREASAWLAKILTQRVDISKIGPSVTLGPPGTVADFDQEMMNQALNAAHVFQNEVTTGNAEAAGKVKQDWSDSLGDVAKAFAQFGDITGSELGGVAKHIGAAISLINQMQESMKAMGRGGAGAWVGALGWFGAAYTGIKLAADAVHGEQAKLEQEISSLGGSVGKLAFEYLQMGRGALQGGDYRDYLREQLELLKQTKQVATDTAAAAEAATAAMGTIGPATSNVIGGFTAKLAPAIKALDELKAKQEALTSAGDTEGAAKLGNLIANQTQELAAKSQAEFDRLNRIALASFNAYIAQGKSAAEAIALVGPGVDALTEAMGRLDFGTTEAYDTLARWRTLTAENQPLLDQVSGLNELMSALGTIGALDAATFADLQAQGVSAFTEMTAAGFTQQQATAQMAPLLENIIKLHEERGLAIDDETQKIIDLAREDGTLRAQQLSTVDVLQQGLGAIIELLGGQLPAAWAGMADDAGAAARAVERQMLEAARGISDEFAGLHFTIPVVYDVEDPSSPSVEDRANAPGFARGSGGLRHFNPSGSPTMLHGWEEVLTAGQGRGVASMVRDIQQQGASGRAGGGVAEIHLGGRLAARIVVPYMQGEVRRYEVGR